MSKEKCPVPSDTEMLDFLERNTRGYGIGWVCRDSHTGRGLRLHETNSLHKTNINTKEGTRLTVREAIARAMESGL